MLSAPYAPARRSQRRRAALVLLTAPASSRPLDCLSATLCGFFVELYGNLRAAVCADGASGDPGPSPQRGGGAIDAGSCPSPAA